MLYLTMAQKTSYILWIIFVSTFFQNCLSNDIITQNQVFKDGDALVSGGSSFAFGFFKPGNSENRYVGIWYNKVSVQTVVWIANRDNPITNGTTGILSLENPGNIVLRDQGTNLTLWSANASRPTTGTGGYFVQLLDTGNLVLYQGDQNSNIVLWQSFDYPTNILLPYMKIGINKTSGLEWSLTSWKSDDDPGTGDLQLRMNLNGSSPYELFFYEKSASIWRSGPWNGDRMTGVPELANDNNFIFETYYVENDEEISFSYAISDPNVVSSLIVNHDSRVMERSTWQENQQRWVRFMYSPQDQCDYYSHCGPFSNCDTDKAGGFECACLPGYQPKVESEWFLRIGSNGCTSKMELGCGNDSSVSPDSGGFIKFEFVKLPDTRNAVVNKGLELRECAEFCLKNCSCSGYASANVSHGGSGCITWYGELIDMRQFSNGGQDFYIRVSAAELAEFLKNLKGSNAKRLIIILASSIGGFLLLTLGILLVVWKRKAKTQSLKDFLSSEHDQVPLRADQVDKSGDLVVFDLKTLFSATNYFGWENKLGEGGFGSVYKGKLDDGKEVAIKRLSKSSGQGIEEFRNEVTLIAKLQHRNLVKLWGCCIERDEKMLVYEHLPNKGLDNFIFDEEKGALLDWQKRFAIILGIARGIVYLHRDSRLRIIHRDLKASNVLLDANLEPKISDFGMARIFNADQMEAQTLRVVGTYGYMSPEYAMQGLFSEKSDVYSYGVLLLEILTGKRNNSYFSSNAVNLPAHVWELWKEGKAMEVIDPIVSDSHNPDEVVRCLHVSLLCVQEHAKDRPSMYEVLSMLCNETSIPSASPKPPAFVTNEINSDERNLQESSSSNYIRAFMDVKTITIVEAR